MSAVRILAEESDTCDPPTSGPRYWLFKLGVWLVCVAVHRPTRTRLRRWAPSVLLASLFIAAKLSHNPTVGGLWVIAAVWSCILLVRRGWHVYAADRAERTRG